MTIEKRIDALEQRTGASVSVVMVPAGEDEDAAIELARATWKRDPELIVLLRRFAAE